MVVSQGFRRLDTKKRANKMGGKGLDGFMGTKFLGFALGLNLLKKVI